MYRELELRRGRPMPHGMPHLTAKMNDGAVIEKTPYNAPNVVDNCPYMWPFTLHESCARLLFS
jgi:hypothetical protein